MAGSVGERLRSLRHERHVTQTYVASEIGVQQQRVCRWEHNIVRPNAANLVKLAAFYGVSPGWLMFGDGDK